MADKEVTFFKFESNINDFLSKLRKKPIEAKPSKFLVDNNFGKERLIRILIKRGILKRKETIKDPTNSDEKVAKYYVKYTIIRDKYEDKVKKLYNDYFKKDKLNECDCGGSGACNCGGSTNCNGSTGQFITPISGVISRPSYGATRKKNKKTPKPEDVLGKTVTAECKTTKRIRLTESQMKFILNSTNLLMEDGEGIGGATTTFSVGAETTRGDMGYDTPEFTGKKKKKSDFLGPAMERKPGFSMKRVGKNGKIEEGRMGRALGGAALGAALSLGMPSCGFFDNNPFMPGYEYTETTHDHDNCKEIPRDHEPECTIIGKDIRNHEVKDCANGHTTTSYHLYGTYNGEGPVRILGGNVINNGDTLTICVGKDQYENAQKGETLKSNGWYKEN